LHDFTDNSTGPKVSPESSALTKIMKPCQTCQTLQKESTQERERKGNKGQGLKSRQANSPTKASHKEESEPLRTEPSLHQSHEANQLKRGRYVKIPYLETVSN
jgi:hypothetical protein